MFWVDLDLYPRGAGRVQYTKLVVYVKLRFTGTSYLGTIPCTCTCEPNETCKRCH